MSDPMVEVDLTKMTSRQLKNHVSKHPEAMAAVEAEEQKRAAAAKNYEKKSQKKKQAFNNKKAHPKFVPLSQRIDRSRTQRSVSRKSGDFTDDFMDTEDEEDQVATPKEDEEPDQSLFSRS